MFRASINTPTVMALCSFAAPLHSGFVTSVDNGGAWAIVSLKLSYVSPRPADQMHQRQCGTASRTQPTSAPKRLPGAVSRMATRNRNA